jgi:predicted Ser/Thr protein kinase
MLGQAPTSAYTPGGRAPTPAELQPLLPQLEILELLGQGGMGAVYKARQLSLDRLVAVKVLPAVVGADPAFAERFQREARALGRLNHPHIVAIYDFGQASGLYYFLMEYVDGVNLRQAMRAGELRPEQALRIVPQVCEALQYAHDEGVVHRDIKPENILLDKRGRVKMADFGLAKLLGIGPGELTLTGTRQAMGTLHYMAPEQVEGARSVDHRADIYSLGVTFYEMLTGELPLGRFPLPSTKAAVDIRLDDVVLRTLEKDPDRRYQHASDVKTEVETITREPAPRRPRAAAEDSLRKGTRTGAAQESGYGIWVGIPMLALTGLFFLVTTLSMLNWFPQASGKDIVGVLCIEIVLLALTFVGLNLAWYAWGRSGGAGLEEVSAVEVRQNVQRAGNGLLAAGLLMLVSGLPLVMSPQGMVTWVLILPVFWSFLAGAIVVRGALAMRQMSGHGYAVTGAVLAMVPLSLGAVLGLPLGLWALLVLRRREVRDEFRRAEWLGKQEALEQEPAAGEESAAYALGWIIGRLLRHGPPARGLAMLMAQLGALLIFAPWAETAVILNLLGGGRLNVVHLAFLTAGLDLWQGLVVGIGFFVLACLLLATFPRRHLPWRDNLQLAFGIGATILAGLCIARPPMGSHTPGQFAAAVHAVHDDLGMRGIAVGLPDDRPDTELQFLRQNGAQIQAHARWGAFLSLLLAASLSLLSALQLQRAGPPGPTVRG